VSADYYMLVLNTNASNCLWLSKATAWRDRPLLQLAVALAQSHKFQTFCGMRDEFIYEGTSAEGASLHPGKDLGKTLTNAPSVPACLHQPYNESLTAVAAATYCRLRLHAKALAITRCQQKMAVMRT